MEMLLCGSGRWKCYCILDIYDVWKWEMEQFKRLLCKNKFCYVITFDGTLDALIRHFL